MGKFNLTKKLDLVEFGEGAYLEFALISYPDSAKIRNLGIKEVSDINKENREKVEKATFDLLREKFISGKLPGKEGLEEVSANDIEELPIEIIERAISFLSGQ